MPKNNLNSSSDTLKESQTIDFGSQIIYNTSMAKDDRITIRVDAELLRQIDKLRRKEADLPNRAEMVRRLIERAK